MGGSGGAAFGSGRMHTSDPEAPSTRRSTVSVRWTPFWRGGNIDASISGGQASRAYTDTVTRSPGFTVVVSKLCTGPRARNRFSRVDGWLTVVRLVGYAAQPGCAGADVEYRSGPGANSE